MADVNGSGNIPRTRNIASVKRIIKKKSRFSIHDRPPRQDKNNKGKNKPAKKDHIDVYA